MIGPHLLPARRRPPVDHAELDRAAWLHEAAWRDFQNAVAHLTLAGQITAGDAALEWVGEQLASWSESLDADAVHALAEMLKTEAADTWARMRDGLELLRRHDRSAA